ncbi:Na(+)/H(+) antiporter subunit B [Myxococcaceae bacterium]|jgi:multicomponent Na+:H+ antiporter subunit B|nr:Na(+)/H(+) antiporter subunit B [Myxococcaceae bacterium]
MKSLVLQTTTRLFEPLFLVFSLFLLLRGHHEPGGGFVGGLVAASAFVLRALAFDVASARRQLRIDPQRLIGIGLAVALASAFVSVGEGLPFMTGVWSGNVGTPLVFDAGVYVTVVGVVLTIVFGMAEET